MPIFTYQGKPQINAPFYCAYQGYLKLLQRSIFTLSELYKFGPIWESAIGKDKGTSMKFMIFLKYNVVIIYIYAKFKSPMSHRDVFNRYLIIK